MHTSEVLEFPPSDYFKKKVSFESLKGTWGLFPVGPGDAVSARIQFPRHDKLWLIFLASSKVCPAAPVFSILSDPAKSTKFNLDLRLDPSVKFYSKSKTNIVWLRDDLAFWLVPATARFNVPVCSSSKISSGFETYSGSTPRTTIPLSGDSLIFSPVCTGAVKILLSPSLYTSK